MQGRETSTVTLLRAQESRKLTLAEAPLYFETLTRWPSSVNTPQNESPCTSSVGLVAATGEDRVEVGEIERDEPDEGGRCAGGEADAR